MTTKDVYVKLDHLPASLLKEVDDFIDFLIAKNEKASKENSPKFGSAKDEIIIADDFYEPLEDFKEYMY